MTESDDNVVPHARVRSLREAVQQARLAEVERDDAIEERRETETTRLELLLDELKPVVDDIPSDDDRFVFAIGRGTSPRLWVDATAHVAVARDGRTYRFVNDTRLGRIVLAESDDKAFLADRVTDHIAARMVERERAIEGDWRLQRMNEQAAEAAAQAEQAREAAAGEAGPRKAGRERDGSLTGLLVGIIVGAALVAGYLHFTHVIDLPALVGLDKLTQTDGQVPSDGQISGAAENAAPDPAGTGTFVEDGAPAASDVPGDGAKPAPDSASLPDEPTVVTE